MSMVSFFNDFSNNFIMRLLNGFEFLLKINPSLLLLLKGIL